MVRERSLSLTSELHCGCEVTGKLVRIGFSIHVHSATPKERKVDYLLINNVVCACSLSLYSSKPFTYHIIVGIMAPSCVLEAYMYDHKIQLLYFHVGFIPFLDRFGCLAVI